MEEALEAVQTAMEVYDQYKQEQNEDLPLKTKLLAIYGRIQMQRGEVQMAKDLYTKALQCYYQILTEDTRELAVAYNNLGNCYNALGDYDKAAQCLLKSAQIIKKISGNNDRALFLVYSGIALSYTKTNKPEEAERYKTLAEEIKQFNDLDSSMTMCY